MKERIENLMIKAMLKKNYLIENLKKDNGDTNFISIIIVLGIVLALVVVFRGYITSILNKIKSSVDNFSNAPF